MSKIETITTTNWKTSDGQLFTDEREAIRHQEIIDCMLEDVTDSVKAKFDEIEEALLDAEHRLQDALLALENAGHRNNSYRHALEYIRGQDGVPESVNGLIDETLEKS